MGLDINDSWLLQINEQLDAFRAKVDEKIEKEQQQLKACKKKTELESKLAHEIKLNAELTERLAELTRRSGELERVCAAFESKLTIGDRDQNRLDNAKETYQLGKELTGVRFDFVAPPDVAKGYIKNSARKILQPFCIDTKTDDSEILWGMMQCADKENTPNNHN
ncbi:uncharacterized protein LOC106138591 [Amyelois transitella]|uniref:uncharacterized protein LOC106138591 n=1 Tax=Amyelois transitella TaxID=680683 RepID=UPI00299069CF|nr:uncharacterized protein LOC106138591 [Amyelois transitella]